MSVHAPSQPSPFAGPAYARPEPRLTHVLLALLAEAGASLDSDRQSARNCLARASALITQASPDRAAAAAPVRGGLAAWQARRILREIASGLAGPLPMTELAGAVRLSTSHFSRAFRASFGISPHAYILRQRVERAQEMMLTTDEPLSQVALACGFCDQAHLSRLFHRITGITPAAWRRHRQEGRSTRLLPASRRPSVAMGREGEAESRLRDGP